ncbi:MAG: SDR family oxidoreductase [Solirubrobacterales bacterium]|nr:SDR family oxidoreductase [Solirubrobacterales bacterium]
MSDKWSSDGIPSQSGRTALVTGANSGLGLRTASALAGAGAAVLMGCRDAARATAARDRILAEHPEADVEIVALDLADLEAVRRAAEEVCARSGPLDLLVNNAGVMAPPRRETADGFELQIGTNHLGHFALTGRLIQKLLASPAARVVNVSSMAHRVGKIDFDDLNSVHGYSRWPAYGQSKLANLLFTLELARRAEAAGTDLVAAAAHPGYSSTNLQTAGPAMGRFGFLLKPGAALGNLLLGQSDAMGALPSLYAATMPDVEGDDYFGPDGLGEQRGHPKRVGRTSRAADPETARRLWEVSEELTGVDFGPLDAADAFSRGSSAPAG